MSHDVREVSVNQPSSASKNAQSDSVPALLLRIDTVVRITGLGRSTIYRLMSVEQFPTPVRLTTRVVAWRRTDLERWSDARPSAAH
jgi:prophage regulatory protein